MSDVGGTPVLREPAHQVSPRAVPFWTVSALIGDALLVIGALVAYLLVPGVPGWVGLVVLLVGVLAVAHVVLMPRIRFRVHRWEVTDTAVYVRTGYFWQEWRVAPMSRIQTVDTARGPLEQAFRLASVTVTTASAAGPIRIRGLDHEVAADLAAKLTEVTQATPGDAT